ncbi:hypothetical protein [Bacillus marinisedimentorum]|uniref:hypothetical protein n=1 Tax=Bacillus marinisedimentorum TaxID=1821260 RepID=UPI000872F889|nr:hypothetical protein [Bacillus marinisedimentorum]
MSTPLFSPIALFVTLLFLLSVFILWTSHTGIGYKLLYLLVFALYMNETIMVLINEAEPANNILAELVPDAFILTLTVMLAALYDDITLKTRKRFFWSAGILLFLLVGFVLDVPPLTFIYSLTLGVFIVYAAYYSSIWLYQAPDLIRFALAFLFPAALFFINPSHTSLMYTGLLVGLSFGFQMEHLKLRIKIPKNWTRRVVVLLIGFPVAILLLWLSGMSSGNPLLALLFSTLTGLWITWFGPALFVKLHLYDCAHGRSLPFKHSY